MGTYLRALRVLGLDGDIDAVGRDDVLGRKLQDLELLSSKKTPREALINSPGPVPADGPT